MECDNKTKDFSIPRSAYKRSDSKLAVDRAIRLSRERASARWDRPALGRVNGSPDRAVNKNGEESDDAG